MSGMDSVAAWLLPFIAPVILYFAEKYAIHRGWLKEPSSSSNSIDSERLEVLNEACDTLRSIDENIIAYRQEHGATLNGFKGSLDRLIELGEARESDGGLLIYQRVPTPLVPSAAAHLDG